MSVISPWLKHSLTLIGLLAVSMRVVTTGGDLLDYPSHEIWMPTENLCPDHKEIEPCMCYGNSQYSTILDCSKIRSENQLREVFNKDFNITCFAKLDISNNQHIKDLKEGDLGNCSFECINIYKSALETIEDTALLGSQDTLTALQVTYTRITTVPDLSNFTKLDRLQLLHNNFTQFPNLESTTLTYLDISNNNLGELPVDALNGLPAIEYFWVHGASLTEIYPKTFTGHGHLNTVGLIGNRLTTLPNNAIRLHGKETQLYLSNNQISHLAPGAVYGLTKELDLYHNNMTELPEDVFKPFLEDEVEILLFGNQFDCECDIAWLILNTTLLERLPYLDNPRLGPLCSSGESFVDLDPEMYEIMCVNVTTEL